MSRYFGPRFFVLCLPVLDRFLTVAAFSRDQAIATASRLWQAPGHRIVVLCSYPAGVR